MSTNILDVAWNEINALGGVPCCSHDHVYNAAIKDALRVIENLGGSDPIGRRNARKPESVTSPAMRGEDVLPLARLDALNGDDPEAA